MSITTTVQKKWAPSTANELASFHTLGALTVITITLALLVYYGTIQLGHR